MPKDRTQRERVIYSFLKRRTLREGDYADGERTGKGIYVYLTRAKYASTVQKRMAGRNRYIDIRQDMSRVWLAAEWERTKAIGPKRHYKRGKRAMKYESTVERYQYGSEGEGVTT